MVIFEDRTFEDDIPDILLVFKRNSGERPFIVVHYYGPELGPSEYQIGYRKRMPGEINKSIKRLPEDKGKSLAFKIAAQSKSEKLREMIKKCLREEGGK